MRLALASMRKGICSLPSISLYQLQLKTTDSATFDFNDDYTIGHTPNNLFVNSSWASSKSYDLSANRACVSSASLTTIAARLTQHASAFQPLHHICFASRSELTTLN